jgi:putative membrane protein
MNGNGLLIGFGAFLMIGAFHPIVIKSEYYIGKQIWPLFALVGLAALAASLFLRGTVASALCAVFGVSCLWSILELFEQEERVKKGWFPKNPKKKN